MGNFIATFSHVPNPSSLKTTSAQGFSGPSACCSPDLRIFSFAELKKATKGFSEDRVLGHGAFGRVYKGWIEEVIASYNSESKNVCGRRILKAFTLPSRSPKTIVAIKRLEPSSMQGFEEWLSEVKFLGSLSHPNLVKLLGYCWEDKELLLVYEYMPKGSLDNHLSRRNPAIQPLSWDRRISIALGAARGLAFLHTLDKPVIFRDFKASDVLLDSNYDAKIADFGLAKLGPSGDKSHVLTRIRGTYLIAPEYSLNGKLYMKSDVYGFGVMLLEILTGQRTVDAMRCLNIGDQNVVEWAKPRLTNEKKLKAIMDARLAGQYTTNAANQMGQLTLKCLETDHKARPSMVDVVEVLERIDSGG